MKKTYAEKLKDPRWQRKRLEIFQRDRFKCWQCGNDKLSLHVHHVEYELGKDPWDYPEDKLLTLCEKCHFEAHRKCGFVKPLAIYMAGKIKKNCWRHGIVDGLRSAIQGVCGNNEYVEPLPSVLLNSVFGKHHYVGPFFVGCDHGCYHGDGRHGFSASDRHSVPTLGGQQLAYKRALIGIENCDLFFAWIDSKDCFGTLVEIGYARALGKDVYIGIHTDFDDSDLWFALDPFSSDAQNYFDNPKEALSFFLGRAV
jgi:hypothetical protein